jgi:hypothetical protein
MDWLASLCVCVCVFLCIYEINLALWARKISDGLVFVSCNHFAVTEDKWRCVVDGLAGLSLCGCVYVYI